MFKRLSGLKKAVFVLFMLWVSISLTGCAGGIMGIISTIMGVVGQITGMFSGESSSDQDSSTSNQDSGYTSNSPGSLPETTESTSLPQLKRSQVLDNENPMASNDLPKNNFSNSSSIGTSLSEPRNGGLFSRNTETANTASQNTAAVRDGGNNTVWRKDKNGLYNQFGKTKDGDYIPIRGDGEVGRSKDGDWFRSKSISSSAKTNVGGRNSVPSTSGITNVESGVSNSGNSNSGIDLGD